MSQSSGYLTREAALSGFDFMKPYVFTYWPDEIPMKLQARYSWDGPVGQPIVTEQHALVAFTQQIGPATWFNPEGQPFWNHGVGVLVGEYGLGMEIWYRDGNGNTNGIVWTQLSNRCALDVLGTLPANSMCLNSVPDANGYLTPAPFQLKYGVGYWIQAKVVRQEFMPPGYLTLQAALLEETATGPIIVQTGSINFLGSMAFPDSSQHIAGTIARTPGSAGEPMIYFDAFDFGF